MRLQFADAYSAVAKEGGRFDLLTGFAPEELHAEASCRLAPPQCEASRLSPHGLPASVARTLTDALALRAVTFQSTCADNATRT